MVRMAAAAGMASAPARNTSSCAGEWPPYGPPAAAGGRGKTNRRVPSLPRPPAGGGDGRNMLRPYGFTRTYPSQGRETE